MEKTGQPQSKKAHHARHSLVLVRATLHWSREVKFWHVSAVLLPRELYRCFMTDDDRVNRSGTVLGGHTHFTIVSSLLWITIHF